MAKAKVSVQFRPPDCPKCTSEFVRIVSEGGGKAKGLRWYKLECWECQWTWTVQL